MDRDIIKQIILDNAQEVTNYEVNTRKIHFEDFGREYAVFFYNKGIEVDFYVPQEELAIQVCYNLKASIDTYEREITALLKVEKVLPCKRRIIISKDEEDVINIDGKQIEVIPIYKWLLWGTFS